MCVGIDKIRECVRQVLEGSELRNIIRDIVLNTDPVPLECQNIIGTIEELNEIATKNVTEVIHDIFQEAVNDLSQERLIEATTEVYSAQLGIQLKKHRKASNLKIKTLVGEIVLKERARLIPKDANSSDILSLREGTGTICPIDRYLGLVKIGARVSINLALKMAEWSQRLSSYRETESILLSVYNLPVDENIIRRASNAIGEIVRDHELVEAEEIERLRVEGKLPTEKVEGKDVIYIALDGATFYTRYFEKNDGKRICVRCGRENKIAVIFLGEDIKECTNKKGETYQKVGARQYVANVENLDDFFKLTFSLFVKLGGLSYKEVVILGDGADWIESFRKKYFPNSLRILDFYHLSENLHKFAKAFFASAPSSEGSKKWVQQILDHLLSGEYERAFSFISKVKGLVYENCVNIYNYFMDNKDAIRYKDYRDKGYFIGSGIVESANKYVMARRLRQSGMFWSIRGAQSMLALRTKAASDQWAIVVSIIKEYYKSYELSAYNKISKHIRS